MKLVDRTCRPPVAGTAPLSPDQTKPLFAELDGWTLDGGGHLTKTYRLPDFKTALALVDRIGATAEEQNHHPELCFTWGRVRVELWTHKVNGLTENDFILAAKCDALRGADR